MNAVLFALCFVSMLDQPVATAQLDTLEGFLKRVEATKWPDPLVKNPPERVARDTEGRIVTLHLNGMKLSQRDIDAIIQLDHLKELSLNNSSITDDQLKSLVGLPRVEALYLNETGIGDGGVASLAQFPSLQKVCMSSIRATRQAVKSLAKAKPKLGIGYTQARN